MKSVKLKKKEKMSNLKLLKEGTNLFVGGSLGKTSIDFQKYDLFGFQCIKVTNHDIKILKIKNSSHVGKYGNVLRENSVDSTVISRSRDFLEEKCFLDQKRKEDNTGKYRHIGGESPIASLYHQKSQGVLKGFFTYLKITGVGYRVFLTGNILTLKLGFSHFVKVQVPESVKVFLPEPTLVCFYGVDKNQITQIAAKVQQLKPPSPYKGKGIRRLDTNIRLKPGKKKS